MAAFSDKPGKGDEPLAAAGHRTTKLDELVAVPPGFVTWIGPVVAAAGTTTVNFESLRKLYEAEVPLKVTDVVPVKPLPRTLTTVPTGPLFGVNEVIEGGTVTTKLDELVPVPAGFVTWIGPVVAPVGTVAVSCVLEFTVKLAATPAKLTALVPVKLVVEETGDLLLGSGLVVPSLVGHSA